MSLSYLATVITASRMNILGHTTSLEMGDSVYVSGGTLAQFVKAATSDVTDAAQRKILMEVGTAVYTALFTLENGSLTAEPLEDLSPANIEKVALNCAINAVTPDEAVRTEARRVFADEGLEPMINSMNFPDGDLRWHICFALYTAIHQMFDCDEREDRTVSPIVRAFRKARLSRPVSTVRQSERASS
jgi:hypothetical protein